MFFDMLVGHVIADWVLQPKLLSKGKYSIDPLTRLRHLFAHSAIHGAMVHLATGIWWLFFAEMFAHAGIDWLKMRGKIGAEIDQILHIICKGLWLWLVFLTTS